MDNDYGKVNSLEITLLLEDYAGYDEGLLAQHGISFLLEAETDEGSKTILFDAGQSAVPVLHNMETLGKDPSAVDLVVLSHCHYDHSGGLVAMLEAIGKKRVPVIAHPA
ncbi:MAG: MBL fold metallo-hydrolase, partial [Bacillota bacterium]